jgi:hypothetical protein
MVPVQASSAAQLLARCLDVVEENPVAEVASLSALVGCGLDDVVPGDVVGFGVEAARIGGSRAVDGYGW